MCVLKENIWESGSEWVMDERVCVCVSETEACDENLKFPDVKGYVMLLITHSLKKKICQSLTRSTRVIPEVLIKPKEGKIIL